MTEKESPFACSMSAIAADQREAHRHSVEELFKKVQSVDELPNGYSFRLPNEPNVVLAAAHFIELERLCCPFFGFRLEVEREGGGLTLSLTGREGVKPFTKAEIGTYLSLNN